MTDATLQVAGPGQVRVSGPVVFATAGDLLEASRNAFGSNAQVTVDLSGVTDVDSAGLALLIEWLRWSLAERRRLEFRGVPDKLLAIARISGVAEMLAPS